jgi:hypothetical protein
LSFASLAQPAHLRTGEDESSGLAGEDAQGDPAGLRK